ncbi:transposase [Candidatus Pacearchaeota archaeon]|nr:transposase [Candidatus Pacearchaeota archaeon]
MKDVNLARNYLDKWYYWASHSNVKEIIRLGKMINNHYHGILESIRSNLNNGVVEGLNNKIKTGFKRSYGFKTEKYMETMIYLMAGKLKRNTIFYKGVSGIILQLQV